MPDDPLHRCRVGALCVVDDPNCPKLKSRLHAAGIPLGIIYNGDGQAQSGIGWTRQSEERFRNAENGARLIPDQALLQSWTRQPDDMLPEDKPGTMTWLVNQYVN